MARRWVVIVGPEHETLLEALIAARKALPTGCDGRVIRLKPKQTSGATREERIPQGGTTAEKPPPPAADSGEAGTPRGQPLSESVAEAREAVKRACRGFYSEAGVDPRDVADVDRLISAARAEGALEERERARRGHLPGYLDALEALERAVITWRDGHETDLFCTEIDMLSALRRGDYGMGLDADMRLIRDMHEPGHPHLIGGQFQSDKYPSCPRGKVPLSCKDKSAQPLLWEYAQRRRAVDAEFASDLEIALKNAGYEPKPQPLSESVAEARRAVLKACVGNFSEKEDRDYVDRLITLVRAETFVRINDLEKSVMRERARGDQIAAMDSDTLAKVSAERDTLRKRVEELELERQNGERAANASAELVRVQDTRIEAIETQHATLRSEYEARVKELEEARSQAFAVRQSVLRELLGEVSHVFDEWPKVREVIDYLVSSINLKLTEKGPVAARSEKVGVVSSC